MVEPRRVLAAGARGLPANAVAVNAPPTGRQKPRMVQPPPKVPVLLTSTLNREPEPAAVVSSTAPVVAPRTGGVSQSISQVS